MISTIKTRARDLSYQTKKEVIQSYQGKELEFHNELKILFERIDPNSQVYILQGNEEKGKDLVIREQKKYGDYNYTAVVVKTIDKLTGSANGSTATLAMQVMQAFNTPAQLEDLHEEVNISNVIVVITGSISHGAKEKILKASMTDNIPAYKHNVVFFDISRLIELFTDHYPEFFFNDTLEVFFQDRLQAIQSFLLEEKQLKHFIDPKIKKFEKTKKELLAQNNSSNTLKLLAEQIYGHTETFDSFMKLIISKKAQRILLTGEAGSGKTVLLFKILLEFINSFLKTHTLQNINNLDDFSLPVCFRAIDLKNNGLDNFSEQIESFYSQDKDNNIKTIIIDGIDEVEKEFREKIKNKVEAYVNLKNPNINIVISSRINTSIIELFETYTQYELLPYEIRQAIEYISHLAKKENILLTNLENSLKELEGQIPFYPLSLKLLIEVVEKHNEIPASITELYSKYIAVITGEHGSSPEIDQLFEPSIKKTFFAELAYNMFFLPDKIRISSEEYKDFCKYFFSKYTFITNQEVFLDNILRVGLLKIEDDIQFTHKSFLDFFIAVYFLSNKEELMYNNQFNKLYEIYSILDQWEDVVFFYFGLQRKISKIDLQNLRKQIDLLENEFELKFNKFYLGKLLQYAWMTETSYKEEIICDAMDLSLDLKNMFYNMLKENMNLNEIPKILSSISMFHLIGFCYGSTFLKNEIKQIITQEALNNESRIYFSTIYLLRNANLLDSNFINKSIETLLPKIQGMSNLEDKILLTMLIDFFEKKKEIILDEQVNKAISKTIKKYKKKYPEVFKKILSSRKKDFVSLRQKLLNS